MLTHLTRTVKSAKRMAVLTLFSALAIAGATGTIFGASSKTPFTVTVSPASQTVTAGESTTFAVSLARSNKFTSAVTLSVEGLPQTATHSFAPNPLTGSVASSSLSINVAGSTAPGSYPLTITGTSGTSTSSKSVTLTVLAAEQPNFSLTATPGSRVISEDDSASYGIDISRSGGFEGDVAFSVSGLPKEVSGQFAPPLATGSNTTLTLTSAKPKAGSYTLTITGIGSQGGTQITRSVPVQLVVEEKKPFQIAGDAQQQLVPGAFESLDLTLTNPHSFPLAVTDLTVSVDHNTSAPACDGADNYTVDQVPADRYPIGIPANSSKTLTGDDRPVLWMKNLLTQSQDACKGATIYLHYSGEATK